jgi:hypothetical protein
MRGRVGGQAPDTAIGGIQPPDHRVKPKQLSINRQRQAEIVLGRVLLNAVSRS